MFRTVVFLQKFFFAQNLAMEQPYGGTHVNQHIQFGNIRNWPSSTMVKAT